MGLFMGGGILGVAGVVLLFVPVKRASSSSGSVAANDESWFRDVADECGIRFEFQSGQTGEKYYMPETMGGGVAMVDYNGDGLLDVYLVQGGRIDNPNSDAPGNVLYRNLGDGTFVDVTESAGVGHTGYGMGCATGDFNNDGHVDIYITNAGPNVLYRNNGDGTFDDVTAGAGVGDASFSASAAFVDYDHDGDLDIFVANYVRWLRETERICRAENGQIDYCGPNDYGAPAPDMLFRNNGADAAWSFTDVTEQAGLSVIYGNGLGVVCGDVNGDGLIDISVANDLTANQLWINAGDGTFRDRALGSGVAYNGSGMAEAGMGIDLQDVDRDGDLDIYMTHFEDETNTLYINEGGFFADMTDRAGLAAAPPFTGFGTALIDFDNDGLIDIYVVNGRVEIGHTVYQQVDPYVEPNQLFQGLADNTFVEVMPRGGTLAPLIHTGRGAAFGDYDNDGDVDIIVVNRDGPTYVLNNLAAHGPSPPDANHWIAFRVLNQYGSDAIGARVEIDVGGERRIRDVRTAYSYCSANDPRVYFGLGPFDGTVRVLINRVDGTVQDVGPLTLDRIHTIEPADSKVED